MKLADLSLTRLGVVYRRATGEPLEKGSTKKAAVAAVGELPKKRIVLGLLSSGGVTVAAIEELFSISRVYARDIIAKLAQAGEKIEQDGDVFRVKK